jgi:hypothetical protein
LGARLKLPDDCQLVAESVVFERRHPHQMLRSGRILWQRRWCHLIDGPHPVAAANNLPEFRNPFARFGLLDSTSQV